MKSISRHDSGFSTLSTLIVCLMIIMMISSVGFFLGIHLRLRKKMDDEIIEKKAMLNFFHSSILKAMNENMDRQEDSRFDEVWRYNDVETDMFSIEIINDSALLNINLLDEKFINSQAFKKYICDEFDVKGFLEDRSMGLYYSHEEYLKYFGTEHISKHFTLNSFVNVNQCDRNIMEYLLMTCFDDERISNYLISKFSLNGNKIISSDAEFMLLAGIYYNDLSSYFTYLPQINVNFVNEDLLCSIFSYLQIPGWRRKLDYILNLRKDSIITEKKLKEIFSEKEYLKIFPWFGTRNYSYSIFLRGKYYDSRFNVMRNTEKNMFEVKEVSWERK